MVQFTTSGYAGTETLENFPVLVKLAEGLNGFSYANCASDGKDVRFLAPSGDPLSREIDTWNPNGVSTIWVSLPAMTSTTSFLMTYGDPTISAQPASQTDGSVWTLAGYIGVWHLGEGGGDAIDSTGHGLTGAETMVGGSSTAPESKVGGARLLSAGKVKAADYESKFGGQSDFTASGWFYFPGAGAGNRTLIDKKCTDGAAWNAYPGWYFELNDQTKVAFIGYYQGLKTFQPIPDASQNWNYFTIAKTGARVVPYINGSGFADVSISTTGSSNVALGLLPSVGGYYDEYRIRGVCDSADWAKACYDTMASDSFVSAGFPSDALFVGGSPAEYGETTPAYGCHGGLVPGASVTCSSPESVNIGAGVNMVCTGYVWRAYATSGAILGESVGAATSFSYDQSGFSTVDWLWKKQVDLTISSSEGGRVTGAESGAVDSGTVLTLTAVPDDGFAFAYWEGDAASSQARIAVTADKPKSVRAVFVSSSGEHGEKRWVGAGTAGAPAEWTEPSNWDPAGVPTLLDNVTIPSGVCRIPVSAAVATLTVNAGATLQLASSGAAYTALPLDADATTRYSLNVLGNVANAGTMILGGRGHAGNVAFTVGGTLGMSGSSVLAVYAGAGSGTMPADFRAGGAQVVVAGDITLSDKSRVLPVVSTVSGLPVVFSARDVSIASEACVDATQPISGSTWWGVNYETYSWSGEVAPGYPTGTGSGGSYGGLGGNSGKSRTYGFAWAPFYPGSPGCTSGNKGGWGYVAWGLGGGAIRIDCRDVTLDGRLRAPGGPNGGINNGAGSGGSIWVTCRSFTASSTARIEAFGGVAGDHDGCGGGGGGRIAIMDGSPTPEQITALYETGTCEGVLEISSDLNDAATSPIASATSSVAGGLNSTKKSDSTYYRHGQPGTMVYLRNRGTKVAFTVAGDQVTTLTTPAYGSYTSDPGAVTVSAPATILEEGTGGLSRFPVTGYTLRVGGTSTFHPLTAVDGVVTDTINITADTTVTWNFGTRQYLVDIRTGGYGSLSRDGNIWRDENTSVAVSAVADAGASFLYWVGDLEPSQRRSASITVPVDRARTLIACFKGPVARSLTWSGETEPGDWFNPANWDGVAIPGPEDAVTVAEGTFQVKHPVEMTLASLTMNGSAVGYFGSQAGLVSVGVDVSLPVDEGDSRPYALSVTGGLALSDSAQLSLGSYTSVARADLAVGGDLALSGTSKLRVYAGEGGAYGDVNTYRNGGAAVRVAGAMKLLDSSVVYPTCHRRTGAPVVFMARSVTIAPGAAVDANYRGWGHDATLTMTGYEYTFYGFGYDPSSTGYRFGGSYGGKGYNNTIAECGHLLAPFYPGSPGHANSMAKMTELLVGGGGAIRLQADTTIALDGGLLANGFGGYMYGGGSGGGVWLTCRSIILGETARIEAKGGNATQYSQTGGGAGGRIAITLKATPEQIDEFYASGTARSATVMPLSEVEEFAGRFSVAYGIGYEKDVADADAGTDGTAVFVRMKSGLVVIFR